MCYVAAGGCDGTLYTLSRIFLPPSASKFNISITLNFDPCCCYILLAVVMFAIVFLPPSASGEFNHVC